MICRLRVSAFAGNSNVNTAIDFRQPSNESPLRNFEVATAGVTRVPFGRADCRAEHS
jgi:hypothetical protein